MNPILHCEKLTRDFTQRGRRLRRTTTRALDALALSIAPGEAVGYIGENGAGKSTTIKMTIGILRPTSGLVRTCGLDPMAHRIELARHAGVVFGQRSQLWWDLPTAESFTILAAIHRLDAVRARARTAELVERLDLASFLRTPVRRLSLGQRMRAEIAAALLHEPRLLILDEPTIGLDVLVKARLREFLREQRREHGTTLLLTTHDMGDIERLCERILLVDTGRLVYDGDLAGLARRVGVRRVLTVDLAAPMAQLPPLLASDGAPLPVTALPGTGAADGAGLRHRLAFDAEAVSPAALIAALAAQVEIGDLAIEEPAIEDVVARVYASRTPGSGSGSGSEGRHGSARR